MSVWFYEDVGRIHRQDRHKTIWTVSHQWNQCITDVIRAVERGAIRPANKCVPIFQKLVGDLETNEFKISPYDLCVANKVGKGQKLTMCCHVDDMKISHVDRNVVTNTITWLESIYG